MADKKLNKISIKPMNNHAAIASTLGISANSAPAAKQTSEKESRHQSENAARNEPQNTQPHKNSRTKAKPPKERGERSTEENKLILPDQGREVATTVSHASRKTFITAIASPEVLELPLMIEIKRKFPGKELFILSLLYLQRNQRGLVQMTVNSMMTLYSSVFEDVIKDDTVRRSLKRLYDAGCIKTISIPGNNSGYIYEVEDLLETGNLTVAEKEEFAELTAFVQTKLNAPVRGNNQKS